jgi:hypothetical protein
MVGKLPRMIGRCGVGDADTGPHPGVTSPEGIFVVVHSHAGYNGSTMLDELGI